MNRKWLFGWLVVLLLNGGGSYQAVRGQQQGNMAHLVEVGDTWAALAWRYGVDVAVLQSLNPHPNPLREPTIGGMVFAPAGTNPQLGQLIRTNQPSYLELAIRHNQNLWQLARLNGASHPAEPTLYRPIFVPAGTNLVREYPVGFDFLELSEVPARPGRAIAYRATTHNTHELTAQLDNQPFPSFANGQRAVGVSGTGAFYPPGAPSLSIVPAGEPLWSQPWTFVDDTWDYDRVTLTGDAAAIDQASIDAERARLFELWAITTPTPQWQAAWQEPLQSYLSISSTYGARRSYNGGPFRTYHEGVDFAAYGGTQVLAPAGGTIILAETLYVRGGAVIIDHGLGIYSGYYHLSAVHATSGQVVQPGTLLGEVGTTGFSSGNHLHWDLLINRIWVDAAHWRESNLACWITTALGTACN